MNDPFDTYGIFNGLEVQGRLQQYLEQRDTNPIHVDLDITTACNYRCPHCGDLARGQLNRGGMSKEILRTLIDDMSTLGVRNVSLIGGGEPMASPYFGMVVQGLHARGIHVGVVTNGSLITPLLADEIAQVCSWIRISLDAATSETYHLTHLPPERNAFSVVLEGIAGLVARMPGRIGISFLVMNRNLDEIAEAAALARNLGCAYVRLRLAQHPLSGAFLPIRDEQELARQLEASKALECDKFKVSIAESLQVKSQDDLLAGQSKSYARCHVQSFGLTIAGTGSVYVCSRWRGDPDAEIGSVCHERLTDIWSGARRNAVVQRLDPSIKCANAHCQAHRYNSLLESMVATARPAGMMTG